MSLDVASEQLAHVHEHADFTDTALLPARHTAETQTVVVATVYNRTARGRLLPAEQRLQPVRMTPK